MQEAKGQEPQTQRLHSRVSTREAQIYQLPPSSSFCPEDNGYAPQGSTLLPFCRGKSFYPRDSDRKRIFFSLTLSPCPSPHTHFPS